MLVKRRLSLGSAAVLAEPIVRREDLADTQLASEVLDTARFQADQLLAQVQEHAQGLLDQALAEFWDTANGFLQSLEEQRVASQRDALASAEELLNLALERLLDETSLVERIRALARNLAASQVVETAGTLSCHPKILEPLGEWLADSRFADHWQLKGDTSMPPDALRLSHANGAFDIDWRSLRRGLLPQGD
ncbi:type III secretion system stator protein SctL [Pseudomonas sp. RTC3]|uniref:type III secretion system stator protein SctL n=1 Tax=Pseudomonas sp. 5C2 TaxID=3048588 RepID=UPI002AB33449|nr:type III secretion system stator protein SctL [Pseudomonas sp. 5C2]MDY7564680.1 type III secretion system stator protein SctL [Pseudomonas sp. 5C2]MEB0060673.1 type III secretion system stator protein SctL [Pseudomonas sp. RTC3]MEB0240868.1 type III secretion system stator protein SctL [Pseudomonas sp. 5C2]